MNKYDRTLELIVLLTDNHHYTAQELAQRLDITRRNVYYYFEHLKTCGFKLIKTGTHYRLDRHNAFFRKLHDNIALSTEEALFLYRSLETSDRHNYLAQSVRMKLERYYNLQTHTDPLLAKRARRNVAALRDAMKWCKMAVLKGYSSNHSKTVADRIVEPFLWLNNEQDVRCYEIKSHANKTFKVSRMQEVEVLDVEWLHEADHKLLFTDVFGFSGETKESICLRLGQLSHNLLLEEYPQSEAFITPEDGGTWLFRTEVVSFLGVGRFVLGLYDDIEVIGNEALKDHLRRKIAQMCQGKGGVCAAAETRVSTAKDEQT